MVNGQTNGPRRDPLWDVLDHQGRSLQWLARKTRYSESHIWALKGGRAPASPEFRARCAEALDLPEAVLFHGQTGDSNTPPDREDDSGGRPSTAVRALYGTDGAGSIGRMAYPGAATPRGGAAG